MQPAEPQLDLFGFQITDLHLVSRLDEYTSEKPDQAGAVKQDIVIAHGQVRLDTLCEMVSPAAVCTAQLLLAICILGFAFEETLCSMSVLVHTKNSSHENPY